MTSVTHFAFQLAMQHSGSFEQTAATHSEIPSHPSDSAPPVLHALCEHDPSAGPSHAVHAELVHVWPLLHPIPHVPQLALSFVVFLHVPVQHCSEPAHAFPHVPQFALSVEVSTHTLLHAVCEEPQPILHTPATQLHVVFGGPPLHTVPHAPQCFASVSRSAHALPHTSPLVHVHLPALHVAPEGQTLPHVPQFCGFVCVFPQPTALSVMPPSLFAASAGALPSGSSVPPVEP